MSVIVRIPGADFGGKGLTNIAPYVTQGLVGNWNFKDKISSTVTPTATLTAINTPEVTSNGLLISNNDKDAYSANAGTFNNEVTLFVVARLKVDTLVAPAAGITNFNLQVLGNLDGTHASRGQGIFLQCSVTTAGAVNVKPRGNIYYTPSSGNLATFGSAAGQYVPYEWNGSVGGTMPYILFVLRNGFTADYTIGKGVTFFMPLSNQTIGSPFNANDVNSFTSFGNTNNFRIGQDTNFANGTTTPDLKLEILESCIYNKCLPASEVFKQATKIKEKLNAMGITNIV
jgi:hypothetical protein